MPVRYDTDGTPLYIHPRRAPDAPAKGKWIGLVVDVGRRDMCLVRPFGREFKYASAYWAAEVLTDGSLGRLEYLYVHRDHILDSPTLTDFLRQRD